MRDLKRKHKKRVKDGKKIYEEKIKDHKEKYNSFDEFEKEFSDEDVECLKAYLHTDDEGKKVFEELIKNHPLYKYLICDDLTLNTLLGRMSKLKVVEMSHTDDFYDKIVKKSQNSIDSRTKLW